MHINKSFTVIFLFIHFLSFAQYHAAIELKDGTIVIDQFTSSLIGLASLTTNKEYKYNRPDKSNFR